MNQLNSIINSLISSHPNYSQNDIASLDNLTQYSEGELFDTLTKFLYSVIYLEGKDSPTFLHQALTLITQYNEANQEHAQSFSYTLTDKYIPQPLCGTINAYNKEDAYDKLIDIYVHELGVSETDLEINLKE